MELDPKVIDRIMVGEEEQSNEYEKILSLMGRILTDLSKIKQNQPPPPNPQNTDKEPKIKKELCTDILTKDTTPIEFRKFKRDFIVYHYKEL